jgi:N-acetylated-alpha-linked acidic dipeptidase
MLKVARRPPAFRAMPISYSDAIPVLRALNGHAPWACTFGSRWEGSRLEYHSVEYNVGPSSSFVSMQNKMEETHVTVYNVIGTMKGEIEDQDLNSWSSP